jgi:hypothetical protein
MFYELRKRLYPERLKNHEANDCTMPAADDPNGAVGRGTIG